MLSSNFTEAERGTNKMSGIREVFKKEMARIIKDKKMAFSVFLLPVLIMVGVMYLMNTMISGMENDIESHKPVVYIQNEQRSFEQFLEAGKLDYEIHPIVTDEERDAAEQKIMDGEADLIIEFPEKMDEMIQSYKSGDQVPQVKTYYNPSEQYSNSAYQEISVGVLESYRQTLLAGRVGNLEQISVFTVNADNKDMVIQDEDKASGKALGTMLPYFITILLFAGAMGIGTDMIAGEKERGTMASLLVAPIKRSSIVLGKVFALMSLSGISSMIYVGAMVACMPLMSKAMMGASGEAFNIKLSVSQIVMLAVLLVGVAFLYSAIIALISVFAKTVKEAGSLVMPAYMLVLVVGIMTMFTTGKVKEEQFYIPIYNISLTLQGILSQEVTMPQYGITVAMTFAIGAVLVGVIVKAFESEKVMAA